MSRLRHIRGLRLVNTSTRYVVGGDPARGYVMVGGSEVGITRYAGSDPTLASGTVLFDPGGDAQIGANSYETLNFHVAADGSYLVSVQETTNNYNYIYHCPDPDGAPTTWNYLFSPSSDGTQSAVAGRALGNQNWANVTIGGNAHVIYACYPDNGSAFCRSWISAANNPAGTWTVHWEPGSRGATREVRHFHAVYQCPDGDILYCCGDSDTQGGAGVNGLVKGPASTSWSAVDDTDIPTVLATPGYSGWTGAQQYRAIQVAFIDGHMVWIPDAAAPGAAADAAHGMWRVKDDFSETPYRIRTFPRLDSTDSSFDEYLVGGSAIQFGDEWLFGPYYEGSRGGTNGYMDFYISQTGQDFWPCGRVLVDDGSTAMAFNSVWIDPYLYLSGNYRKRVVSGAKIAVLTPCAEPRQPGEVWAA